METFSLLEPPVPSNSKPKIYWQPLSITELACAIAHAGARQDQPMLIITEDSAETVRLTEELKFFCRQPDQAILTFPDWEILPYDPFSPQASLVSERLAVLAQLPSIHNAIVVSPVNTLLHRLPEPRYILGRCFKLQTKQTLKIEEFRQQLLDAGYANSVQVREAGEFAIRGSIIDLFPTGSTNPFRIDLFDQEIESIRTFDPETQLSITTVDKIELLPAHEFPFDAEAISTFRQQWRTHFAGNPTDCMVYNAVSQGQIPPGIEYYTPLFFTSPMATLFDYLPENCLIIRLQAAHQNAEKFMHDTHQRYQQRSHDRIHPILPPNEILIPVQDFFARTNEKQQIIISNTPDDARLVKFSLTTPPKFTLDRHHANPLQSIIDFQHAHHCRILFCVESEGRKESVLSLLSLQQIKPKLFNDFSSFVDSSETIGITVAPLAQHVCLTTPNITLIAEAQFYGGPTSSSARSRERKSQSSFSENSIRDLMELKEGMPVVHIEHGVAQYLGLESLTINDELAEFVTLMFQGGDKLYVPVTSLHCIARYIGPSEHNPGLNKLGSEQWGKSKRQALQQIRDIAADLLSLYAKRAAKVGFQFTKPETDYYRFATSFRFEETPDQANAIEQILRDMENGVIMDRLVCGDVGFGKTEVAMRAAFIAAYNRKQTAVFVPTTLLAQQHYQSFCNRFADWPVNIEVLSRFKNKKEQEKIVEKASEGKIDILIGTHSLLRKDLKFKDLGLLIIDEEHRFGVKQKEQLKSMRAEVAILTLTATPIPRTLNMAFSGLRDLSLITTPPQKRLAVKTFVQERNNETIFEAISREILRGGQVYFVHNSIESIERTAAEIRELLPDIRLQIAHGQMPERALESVMADFTHQRFQLLLCTAIIESGLDIPSANTIIIDRADHFGLAQLHQLRGRVGRSHHQAYAYLLTPPWRALNADAQKRLEAFSSIQELGAGFSLAIHDLEIRGAGELLGEHQSGNIQAIGLTLFLELLERAVNTLRSGKEIDPESMNTTMTEIELQVPALIPKHYLDDVHGRLIMYKRIANTKNAEALDKIHQELLDRFGSLPKEVTHLLQITELKQRAEKLGIRKIEANARGGRIEFHEKPLIDPMVIIQLIQKESKYYKLDGPNRLRFLLATETAEARIACVSELLKRLGG